MRVSIIGAGRTRNGIGEFIGKYFQQCGANVTSVLGRTDGSTQKAAEALRKYGITARPYTDFREMIDHEKPDLAAIASPSATHLDYLVGCVESSVHVFCEKPFVSWETEDAETRVEHILERAKKKGLIVAMNSQWPFSIPYYEELCGRIEPGECDRFFMKLAPSCTGREMVPESVPHALSLLHSVLGAGKVKGVRFDSIQERELSLRFRYAGRTRECPVHILLATQETQPRDFSYGFNGRIVRRRLELPDYSMFFCHEERSIRIPDPLELSVKNVMEALGNGASPVVGDSHILTNVSGLRMVYEGYRGQVEGRAWKN